MDDAKQRKRSSIYGGGEIKQELKELNGRGIIKMLISRKDGDAHVNAKE